MTTFLTLATGTNGAAAAAQRVTPISGTTPAQSRTRQTFGSLTQTYDALSMTQKGGWQTAANTLNRNQNRVGRHKLTPANVFVTLNSALLACGQAIQTDAPADLAAPPMLPRITVDASAPATTTGVDTAAFSLTLSAPNYSNPVQVLAAPPAPAGKNTFPDRAFKAIGSISIFYAGHPYDITDMYQAAFGVPEPGAQIALKLIATSAAGIRLSPLVLTGVVTAATADSTEPGKTSPLHIG